ncbi:MAG TPA: hypothetical protein VH206_09945 [Xanthobacteraceae bacterium]|nr:hypothetical protein [Xanthobacteraceae bacterium]
MSADLAFNLACVNKPRSVTEPAVEDFMKSRGFDVLNQGRIQQDHGFHLLDTQIVGLDSNREIIEFDSFPGRDGLYTVALRSPPPTHRIPQLEQDILTFVSNSLGCEVRQITRSENGENAISFYNREVERIQRLFHEAGALPK